MSTIHELVIKLSQELKQRYWKLITAESCTGGGLAYHLTNLAGSSDWFERGFVTYSNQSKIELLNVPPHTLDTFGAVSSEVAAAMSQGALLNSEGQISIAITGIAGPGGGSDDKPVGLVWFGLSAENGTATEKKIFAGDRAAIREQAIEHSLELLLRGLAK